MVAGNGVNRSDIAKPHKQYGNAFIIGIARVYDIPGQTMMSGSPALTALNFAPSPNHSQCKSDI